MKKLKFFKAILLAVAATLLIVAIIAFTQGRVFYGICNILWMGCELLSFLINKKSIEIKQQINQYIGFLSVTIEKTGAAIITEEKDGKWLITGGIAVEHGEPSCYAENNDQINYHHIAEEVGGSHA